MLPWLSISLELLQIQFDIIPPSNYFHSRNQIFEKRESFGRNSIRQVLISTLLSRVGQRMNAKNSSIKYFQRALTRNNFIFYLRKLNLRVTRRSGGNKSQSLEIDELGKKKVRRHSRSTRSRSMYRF